MYYVNLHFINNLKDDFFITSPYLKLLLLSVFQLSSLFIAK